jgi:Na+-translocating ferredoxin:NAD+ oxidoreductase subunit D
MTREGQMLVGPAPHIHARRSTASMAWGMSLALLPAFGWGLYCFGLQALIPVLVSVLAALAGEGFISLLTGKPSLRDGSALLSGFLIGLSMPPSAPLLIPLLSSLFAVCLVKGAFGGLGSNWMNPALAGVVFALLNWPAEMGNWVLPRGLAGVSAISGATPLGFIHSRLLTGSAGGDAFSILGSAGYQVTPMDSSITAGLNSGLFGYLGVSLPSGYMDLLVGNKAGAIGELSGLLILAASIVLVARRMIRWEIPASLLSSFGLFVWAFGGLKFGNGFFSGDLLFELLSGSLLLVSFFMATDPVTSPSTRWGRLAYGAGIGILTFVIRSFGSGAEGSAFAVVIMNCLVPAISRLESPRRPIARGQARG